MAGRGSSLWYTVTGLLIAGPPMLYAAGNVALSHGTGFGFFRTVLLLYRFNTWIMPAVLIPIGLLLIALARQERAPRFARGVGGTYLAVGVVAFCVYVYATHIEPSMLVVREVHVQNKTLCAPLRILHISDIQSAQVGQYEARVIERAKALKPDLVLFTGDLLQPVKPATVGSELPKLAALVSSLRPPLGIHGVYGTTDGALHNRRESDLGGIRMLEDEGICATSGVTRIRIYGLSNRNSTRPEMALSHVSKWMEDAQTGDLVLVMGHVPDYAVAMRDLPIDLCLAGHTHGGQVRLPFWGPVVTLTAHIPREWALGFRTIGKTRLNVSGGIGSEHAANLPNMRFCCRPEMTFVTFGPH